MEKKFSIIIPTLFRCVHITNVLLEILGEDDAVSEIIMIDNTVDGPSPDLKINDKVRMYSVGENLYVNPAWNYGVSLAKEDYIGILNDDITIPNYLFAGVLKQVDFDSIGILGACFTHIQEVENPGRFNITQLEVHGIPERLSGYGIFMVMKKDHYVEIPEELLVWTGDDVLFHRNKHAGRQNCLMVCHIQTKMSSTSNDPIFDEIKQRDVKIYEEKYKL